MGVLQNVYKTPWILMNKSISYSMSWTCHNCRQKNLLWLIWLLPFLFLLISFSITRFLLTRSFLSLTNVIYLFLGKFNLKTFKTPCVVVWVPLKVKKNYLTLGSIYSMWGQINDEKEMNFCLYELDPLLDWTLKVWFSQFDGWSNSLRGIISNFLCFLLKKNCIRVFHLKMVRLCKWDP